MFASIRALRVQFSFLARLLAGPRRQSISAKHEMVAYKTTRFLLFSFRSAVENNRGGVNDIYNALARVRLRHVRYNVHAHGTYTYE